MNRRVRDRSVIQWKVRVSSASERRLPEARLVDASRDGALMVLDAPTGFAVGQSIVLSIEPSDDAFVLVADVMRVERGADFRSYVAVAFRQQAGEELDRWAARLAEGEGDDDASPSVADPPSDPPLLALAPPIDITDAAVDGVSFPAVAASPPDAAIVPLDQAGSTMVVTELAGLAS